MRERLESHAGVQRMLVGLAENTIGSRVSSTCSEGCHRLTGWRGSLCVVRFAPLWSLVTGNRRFRRLSAEIDELEKLCVVEDIGCILAVLLPFKHSVDVQFEFEYRDDEGSRGFVLRCLEGSEVLLHSVMQMAQFLATAILQSRSFEDRANVRL